MQKPQAKFTPYIVVGGEALRYDTGSQVKTHGMNGNLGLVRRLQEETYIDTVMLFGEYGRDNYTTFMDSGSRGDGDHSYYGGGVLLRRDNTNGFYYEGSLHGGYVKGSYSGIVNGGRGAYSSGSAYLAMHGAWARFIPCPMTPTWMYTASYSGPIRPGIR